MYCIRWYVFNVQYTDLELLPVWIDKPKIWKRAVVQDSQNPSQKAEDASFLEGFSILNGSPSA